MLGVQQNYILKVITITEFSDEEVILMILQIANNFNSFVFKKIILKICVKNIIVYRHFSRLKIPTIKHMSYRDRQFCPLGTIFFIQRPFTNNK